MMIMMLSLSLFANIIVSLFDNNDVIGVDTIADNEVISTLR